MITKLKYDQTKSQHQTTDLVNKPISKPTNHIRPKIIIMDGELTHVQLHVPSDQLVVVCEELCKLYYST